ncbi:hypothetical protein CISG_04117 [Coccidioides immitis RMSCC 3703]|uniref:Uncharacterized protein n=1 Tax=Coccidioides immitis RMSCC 3703 TaxID=454286 RepID=A0A0J8QV74_COCIT|nr:hypothetical protein CISG_04117 [Coccidioides immitis RMSCC 3703]
MGEVLLTQKRSQSGQEAMWRRHGEEDSRRRALKRSQNAGPNRWLGAAGGPVAQKHDFIGKTDLPVQSRRPTCIHTVDPFRKSLSGPARNIAIVFALESGVGRSSTIQSPNAAAGERDRLLFKGSIK